MGRYTQGTINPAGLYIVEGVNWGTIGMIGKSVGTASLNTAYVINNPNDAKDLFGQSSALYNSILIAFENGAKKVIAVPIDDSQAGDDDFSGDDLETEFTLTDVPAQPLDSVTVGGVPLIEGQDFVVDYGNKKITFTTPPITGVDNINVLYGTHQLTDVQAGLTVLETIDVQIMVGAMIFGAVLLGAIKAHCVASTSLKRVGSYMLKNGETDTSLATTLESYLSILIAHKSLKDVASALAGRMAGLEPWIDLTMKPLAGIEMGEARFTDTEISAFDEKFIITAYDPPKLTGGGEVISTGWTLDPNGTLQFIDLVRVAHHLTEVLERTYNNPNVIGSLPMNLEGLIQLDALTASVLRGWVNVGEINGFEISNPARALFAEGTDINAITNLQTTRRLEGEYRYGVNLKIRASIIFIDFQVALVGGV